MRETWKVSGLLFCSGLCALIYQTAWLRQFRLIFGASTAATAAVLAIFMGGLGLGSALLGRRADRQAKPLAYYAKLELLIAISAAVSPLLLMAIAKLYILLGGSITLGLGLATVVRLLLSTLVLAIPTILMGGTLPAAAGAVETNDDEGRHKLALLYATNTLGAVTGTLLSTFFMLETFGNRKTLFIAVLLNLIVALTARSLAAAAPERVATSTSDGDVQQPSAMPARVVLGASLTVGFGFLLMELVWYRMLAPLLGGSTFTFGLILAIALLGIGLGGAAYSFFGGRGHATAGGFALTCSLEAVAIALPFFLGDRLAVLANYLRSLATLGFTGNIFQWTLLTLIVVFPAALVSGVQFPLLIALLGRGREDVGRQVGAAYAWNTIGAIVGSLAGGFGLLPLLTAPGCWRLVVVLLAALGVLSVFYAMREHARVTGGFASVAAIASIACIFAVGPTALWRHSGIGAGRAQKPDTTNGIHLWANESRADLVWDEDGRESSVALVNGDDYGFIVNGKADGSARSDDGTQVMAGLVGAMLHPNPRRALVIGLGTGSTAGWLGSVPSIGDVDVVELEPAVLRIAKACAPVNRDVLSNPKVHIHIADAREVLLTTRTRYDVIFSEPSNPYRAGIASLFTEEFYRAAAGRLNRNGVFLQWVQGYEVDSQTIRTIFATMGTVFPHVQTWQTDHGDLLLVASNDPITIDMDVLRRRVLEEPYRSAMMKTWRVETAEGFLSHFIAEESLVHALVAAEPEINTDDRTPIEFGFARMVGSSTNFSMAQLITAAEKRNEHQPRNIRGAVNWPLVYLNRASLAYIEVLSPNPTAEERAHNRIAVLYDRGDLNAVYNEWNAHPFAAVNTRELATIAEALASRTDPRAVGYINELRKTEPVEADALMGRLREHQNARAEAAQYLHRALIGYRTDPWPGQDLMGRTLDALPYVVRGDKSQAPLLWDALDKPYSAGQWNRARKILRVALAREWEGCGAHTIAALKDVEPFVPWRDWLLKLRAECYAKSNVRDAERAADEYGDWLEAEPMPVDRGLR